MPESARLFPPAWGLVYLLLLCLSSQAGEPGFRPEPSGFLRETEVSREPAPSAEMPPFPALPWPHREPEPGSGKAWTILFYDDAEFVGYDPLEHFTQDAHTSDQVDVLLLRDTLEGPAELWQILGDGERLLLGEVGEPDMGAAVTLRDFVLYGKVHFPAARYLLCLYDHGSAYLGACVDQSCSPVTIMSMQEHRKALQAAGGVDILAYTAPCNMGAIEAAYELREVVDVYLGSEDLSGYALWHGIFDEFCTTLGDQPQLTTRDLAVQMIQLLADNDTLPLDTWTMSAVAGAELAPLVRVLDELVLYLGVNMDTVREGLLAARTGCWVVGTAYDDPTNMVDLVSWLGQVGEQVTDPFVLDKVTQVRQLYEQALVAEMHGSAQEAERGLSIYYPRTRYQYSPYYTAEPLEFKAHIRWVDFLESYYSGDPLPVRRTSLGGLRARFR